MNESTKGPNPAQPGPGSGEAHPLDVAIRLAADDGSGLLGHTSPAYGNMIGPFGGVIASTLLNAALIDAARLGDPVALTVNFAGPIADGQFRVDARAVRTNRSTQHWWIELAQGDAVCATATAVFARRRHTWASTEIGFPDPPHAAQIERAKALPRVEWTRRYEMRFLAGSMPDFSQPERDADHTSALWLRDDPPRALDFVSLAAICDAFFPRIFLRRSKWTPAGTVSLTTYFHVDAQTLAANGSESVFGTARAQHFGRGFFDQTAEVWSADGTLLANSHQIVYYKE